MATSSSVVLVQPLSDRSNALEASIPPAPADSASITPSKRQLFPHLDSSEETPSENSSICDARSASLDFDHGGQPARKRAKGRSKSPSKGWADEQRPCSGTPSTLEPHAELVRIRCVLKQLKDPPGIAVRFVNRPHATPLTTIIEQKSLATLRSNKSLLATSRRSVPKRTDQENVSDEMALQGPPNRRLVSMTVDEATLRELHQIIDAQIPSHAKDMLASDCVNDVDDPARPGSPIHAPYERTSTPCGVPRWPGDLPTLSRTPDASRQRVSRARSVGYTLRDFFRGPRAGDYATQADRHEQQGRTNRPHRTGRAYWAPPRSGHGGIGLTGAPRGCATGIGYPAETSFETSPPRDPQTDRQPSSGEAQAQQQGTQEDRVQHRHGGQPPAPPPSPQPDVALPSLQASRQTSSPENCTSQGSSGSGRRPSIHSLIPEPLFTSPPHSRRNLDPRVPESPYDRVSCMVRGCSADMPSHSQSDANVATNCGRTNFDFPGCRSAIDSLGSFDVCCEDGHRIVSVSPTVTNRPRSGAFSSSGPPPDFFPSPPSRPTRRAALTSSTDAAPSTTAPVTGETNSQETFLTLQNTPKYSLFPRSTPPPASPSNLPRAVPLGPLNPRAEEPCAVETRATHVIRSAALPALIPIAVSSGLSSRQRPLPRPVSVSSLGSISSSMARPVHVSRYREQRRPNRTASSGSGEALSNRILSPPPTATSPHVRNNEGAPARRSFFPTQNELAPPGAAQQVEQQGGVDTQRNSLHRISCKKGSSSDGEGFEKHGTWGANFGWLMRVCFCQPFDPTDDAMAMTDEIPRSRREMAVGLMEMDGDDAMMRRSELGGNLDDSCRRQRVECSALLLQRQNMRGRGDDGTSTAHGDGGAG
ncbi:hypothetical protein IWX46DRAFT_90397 [Phyllosticta citricarpa]|uniref:Uncharacterized protein n=1 Tax=Phyllosticta citricarpa TaxID=55181 RepID=A0ABR1MDF9_9PEZI